MGEYQWHRFDGTDDAFVMVQMGKGSVGKGHDSKKKTSNQCAAVSGATNTF
jgi:hypothetical protein